MNAIYETLQDDYVIWGLGHGGHDFPPDVTPPSIGGNIFTITANCSFLTTDSLIFMFLDSPEIFTLEGQVNHKIEFIDKYIPDGVNLHLIGHSIGAKICVELVKRYKERNNAAAYLLFPTLERMAETPQGRKMWPILGPLRRPVILTVSLINWLMPETWLHSIVGWFLGYKAGNLAAIENKKNDINASSSVNVNVRTTVRLLHPEALERSLFMAHDEFKVVRELNAEDIRQHSDR